MNKKPLKPKYFGRLSLPFWNRIRDLKGEDNQKAFDLGVQLQALENRVYAIINKKEEKKKKTPILKKIPEKCICCEKRDKCPNKSKSTHSGDWRDDVAYQG